MLQNNFRPGLISSLGAEITNFVGGFLINDPTTPNLVSNNPMPLMGSLKYSVTGLSNPPKNTNEKRALNCHFVLGNCINAIQPMLDKPLGRWAATNVLGVVPAAGAEMNAYYDRRSLRFFYHNFRGKNTYFSDSADIINHELGHAILDAMRPDFWSVQGLEIWSFHEAFSDITALFAIMKYDSVAERVLVETGGNLRKSNSASRLAEEVGALIRAYTNNSEYMGDALRDPSREIFQYVNPSALSQKAPNNRLAAECHSFGRVFSSAWYEAFVRTYELMVSKGQDRASAFRNSRDLCYSVMLKAVPLSPRTNSYFSAIAKCMVSVARNIGPEHAETFLKVFEDWKIIQKESVRALSSASWGEVVVSLRKGDKVFKKKDGGALVSMHRGMSASLSELDFASMMSAGEDLKVELPGDHYYEFDSAGKLVDETIPEKAEVLKSASACVQQALQDGMWEPREGRLVRKLIR